MANKKKKISFEDSLDDTDFGLIISAKGELKGMYIPDQMNEMDYMPRKLCKSSKTYMVWILQQIQQPFTDETRTQKKSQENILRSELNN